MKRALLFFCLFSFSNSFSQDWGENEIVNPNPGTENNYPNNILPDISSHEYWGDRFGTTVEIDGDYAAISAPGKHDQLGVVHIYKKDANGIWNHLQEIIEYTERQYGNYFGHSLAFNGDYLFVGSPGHRINAATYTEPAGAVLVYKKNANGLFVGTQILRNSDISQGDLFNTVVSQGNFLLISASRNSTDENGNNSLSGAGAIYVFNLDANGEWQQTQKIVPSVRGAGNYFGEVIDVDGDYFVTASKDTTDENNQAANGRGYSVFIFKKDANGIWSEIQKLKCSNPSRYGSFGRKGLSISNDFISVSASSSGFMVNNEWYYSGIFMYKKDANGVWNEHQILNVVDATGKLGTSLALNDHLLIASDPDYFYFDNGVLKDKVGAVNLFVKDNTDTWVYVDRYLLANPIPFLQASGEGDLVGGSAQYAFNQVAVSGNTFLFGAPKKEMVINGVTKHDVGSAYFSGDIEALGLLSAPLSVKDISFKDVISAYPNPTTNNLFINLKENYSNIKVIVFSLLGKAILTQEFSNTNSFVLDLKNFKKGIYLTKIKLDNNKTKVLKVVKK